MYNNNTNNNHNNNNIVTLKPTQSDNLKYIKMTHRLFTLLVVVLIFSALRETDCHNLEDLNDPNSVYKLRNNSPRINVIYSRVSTYKQKNQLKTQITKITEYTNKNNINVSNTYSDIASGLSLDRKEFSILLDKIFNYEINSIIITNKDSIF